MDEQEFMYVMGENKRLKAELKELREIYDRLRTRHTEIEERYLRLTRGYHRRANEIDILTDQTIRYEKLMREAAHVLEISGSPHTARMLRAAVEKK